VNHTIREVGEVHGKVVCHCRISIKLKGKFNKTIKEQFAITKCWVIKKQHVYKTSIAEMRVLRWIVEKQRKIGYDMKKFF
jgi:hypothetical protein